MRRLLEQHVPGVYRFSLRLTRGRAHEAEDLTQETMLRAWRHREKLRDPATARIWLLRITVNLWRDQLRRGRVRRAWEATAPASPSAGPAAPPDRPAQHREELDRALRTLDTLPPRQREVLYLNVCEELTLVQISEVLGIKPGAVKASLSLARQRMRADLDRHRRPEQCGERR